MDLGFKGGFSFLDQRFPSHPFDIVWANDLNRSACKTYEQNVGAHIVCGGIWDLLAEMPIGVDVIIGGFPCQDISVNGKGRGVDGSRSGLYRAMVEAIRRVKPKVFVAENVKGLLMRHNRGSLRRVMDDFGSLGYDVSLELYQAADYGVPQTRERIMIVGTLPSVRRFVRPDTRLESGEWVSASRAIADLSILPEDQAFNHIWSRANKSAEQGNRKLRAERPGYTIRAECHGNIQFHYSLRRRISMREAARIQSFPDNFIFVGGIREIERQVGNAVPPVLAWHIASSVAECLTTARVSKERAVSRQLARLV
jgi:DNA (cytosine-5)-methyltransferase 1